MDEGFTIISNNILENENLSIQETMLLIALISYENKEKGFAYPSYKQLKSRCRIADNRTLIKNVNSLIEKGFIKKETAPGRGCKYFINENIPSGELHQVEEYTSCNITLPPSGELHYQVVENYTTTNTNTNTNINTNMCTLENAQQLWQLYPKKKGKAAAIKKIPKLIKQYGFDEIARTIERYVKEIEVKGTQEQYILMGSTFFNGRYADYLDENYIHAMDQAQNSDKYSNYKSY